MPKVFASQLGTPTYGHLAGGRAMFVRLEKRKLEALAGSAKWNLTRMIKDIAQDVQRQAQQLAPIDTGALVSSIEIFESATGTTVAGPGTFILSIAVGSRLEYSGFVELGTSRQAAQPYLLPAFEMQTADIAVRVEEYLIRRGLRDGNKRAWKSREARHATD